MPQKTLDAFLKYLLEKTGKWIAIRTNHIGDFEDQILSRGFETAHISEENMKVGILRIYARNS